MFEKNQKNDPAENDQIFSFFLNKRINLKLCYELVSLGQITCFNKLTFRVEKEHQKLTENMVSNLLILVVPLKKE